MKRRYPEGRRKAFNITYDDGVEQDIPFIEMMNRYGLKGTFNLNSQLMYDRFQWIHESGLPVRRLGPEQTRHLYDGHEVASHTLTHPWLDHLTREELLYQMGKDKAQLEAHFEREVCGFAAPFDYFSPLVAQCAEELGFEYARTSNVTGHYTPCHENFYLSSGFYHIMPGLREYVDQFLKCDEELALCHIVGHSYDLEVLNLWDTMDGILRDVSACPDVWSCTTLELVRYINAMDKAIITETSLHNGSDIPLWFSIDGKTHELLPGETANI